MNAYFDTAIILKLYVQEATSPDAVRYVNEHPAPYPLTLWQEIEVRTALRLKSFRKEITATEMQASLGGVEFGRDLRVWFGPAPAVSRLATRQDRVAL